MSDLLKQTLKKNHQEQDKEEDYAEEQRDQVIDLNEIDFPQTKEQNMEGFQPIDFQKYLKLVHHVSQGKIPIYFSKGKNDLIIFCIHGAGLSAASFSLLADNVKDFASLAAYDMRGHGFSKNQEEFLNYQLSTLSSEAGEVLLWLSQNYKQSTFVLLGHSLGGAIAALLSQEIQNQQKYKDIKDKVLGLFVIDVVEGTAKEAIPFMRSLIVKRPKYFTSEQKAILYMKSSNTIKNLESARISTPPLIERMGMKFYWKTNLLQTEKYWQNWFKDLNKNFLTSRLPKVLLLAAPDRMDKELTVAQMQGKFKLQVSKEQVGHHVHEDDPKGTAQALKSFLKTFKIPLNIKQLEEAQILGLKFDNNL